MEKKKNYFKYVVLGVVLLIPFIYSFFYLKAYWNPYGKGNMDNLPIAIVNQDKGEKGKDLTKQIIDSKSLKVNVVSSKKAEDGLNNKDYYAVITIPSDFTESLESVSTENKKHPTITYSPNQKTNYLASQIIDRVVSTVEANLDNTINSEIIDTLEKNLNGIPNQLGQISDGFSTMHAGVDTLNTGSKKLTDGSSKLYNSYKEYNEAIRKIQSSTAFLASSMDEFNKGVDTLASSKDSLTALTTNVSKLANGLDQVTSGSNNFTQGITKYKESLEPTLEDTIEFAIYIKSLYENPNVPEEYKPSIDLYKDALTDLVRADALKTKFENELEGNNKTINATLNVINTQVSTLAKATTKLDELTTGVATLQKAANDLANGTKKLSEGMNTVSQYSNTIEESINELSKGNKTLNTGIETLKEKVLLSKNTLDTKIDTTKEDLEKTNNLTEYSKQPVTVEKKEVNKVDSYGTAFSPLFISIGLWIGSLMLYIVLFFDKEGRFKTLDEKSNKLVKRTLSYHGLATISSIILGILLSLFLDFSITNYFLYLVAIVLAANTFTAIMNFLIVNFKDIGKFVALIILVLQLAASGGTFPIETVTKGFRWLHNFLPMTYTINLFKECLVTIENSLLTKNLIIVICIFLVFFVINILMDLYRQKRAK